VAFIKARCEITMDIEDRISSEVVGHIKVGVGPLRKFSRPLILKTYATSADWWQAALEASKRMAVDEAFRKEIEEFSS